MLGEQVIAFSWSVDQRRVSFASGVVFDVGDQTALMKGIVVDDHVAYEVFGGFNGKGTEGHEQSKEGKRQPLVFGFLLEESPPAISHERC